MEIFKKKYKGVVEDPRAQKEQAKDWDSREIALGAGNGGKIERISIDVYDQMRTSSCTAHAVLSMLEYNKVLEKKTSRFPLYRKRFNYPLEGSNATDLLKKSHSKHSNLGGLTNRKDIFQPSYLEESWANSLKFVVGEDIAVPFNYFTVKDWDDLERTVNSGVAVTIGIYGTIAEWSREYVEETDKVTPNNAKVRHQVTLIPNGAFREKGKLWFSVHDSAKFGGLHLRYATFEFLKNRVIVQPQFAIPDGETAEVPPPAKKTFRACKIGDRGDAVLTLQTFLADKGFLEKKYTTGYYGVLSSSALLWYQLTKWEEFKNSGIEIPELLDLNGEHFGKVTIKIIKDEDKKSMSKLQK